MRPPIIQKFTFALAFLRSLLRARKYKTQVPWPPLLRGSQFLHGYNIFSGRGSIVPNELASSEAGWAVSQIPERESVFQELLAGLPKDASQARFFVGGRPLAARIL